MVGEDGLEEELEMVGLRVVKEGARPPPGMTEDEFRENDHDPEVTDSSWGCFRSQLWSFVRGAVVVVGVMSVSMWFTSW